MATFNLGLNTTPLPGLTAAESKDYSSWLKTNATAGGRMLAANATLDQVFTDSPAAKMALAHMAPSLTPQLRSRNPAKEAIGMLSVVLSQTQNDLYTSLFQGDNPDWQAQTDASQRAQDTLETYRSQYGFVGR